MGSTYAKASKYNTETLQYDSGINAQNKYGETALMLSAIDENVESVQRLLSSHAEINLSTITGKTAVILAASRGKAETLQLLINANADVNAFDRTGSTALHYASNGGFDDCIKQLLQAGANVNAKNNHAYTGLCNAAQMGHMSSVVTLMNAGADKKIKNLNEHTAWDIAVTYGYKDIARVIDAKALSDFETWLQGMKIPDADWNQIGGDKKEELREKYYKIKGVSTKKEAKVDENNNEAENGKDKK